MPNLQPVQEVHTLDGDGYHSFLTSGLHELYKQDAFCDFTIKVGLKTFKAHKAILSVAIPYFRTMFTSGLQETSSSEAIIEGDSATFESLLKFAYSGNLCLSEDTMRDVLSMASYMQFDKALQLCEKYIVQTTEDKSLSFVTACDLLPLAAGHALQDIAGILRKYLMKNVVEFSKTSIFVDSQAVDVIVDCFTNEDAMAKVECPEEQILTIMLHWIRHDLDKRKTYAASLLKQVHLCLVPLEHLKKLLDGDELPGCESLLTEAIQLIGANKDVTPLTLAKRYPSMYAPRGLTTALMQTRAESDTVYYNTTRQCWVPFSFPPPTTPSPQNGTMFHTMILVGDDLYAAGGVAGPDYCTKTNNFCKYNSVRNTWDELDGMSEPHIRPALVELDGFIYAMSDTPSVERYNIAKGKWSTPGEISPMLAVNKSSAVVFDGNILVYGANEPGVMQMYIPSTNTWYAEPFWLLDPTDDAEKLSENFAPILKVHKGNCYLVYSVDPEHGTVPCRLHVVKLDIRFGAEGIPSLDFLPENLTQDLPGCAIAIEGDVFVIANECIHDTGVKVIGRESKVDLGVWKGVFNEFLQALDESVVCYTFDKHRLPDTAQLGII